MFDLFALVLLYIRVEQGESEAIDENPDNNRFGGAWIMVRILFRLFFVLFFPLSVVFAQSELVPRIETYVTPSQMERLFATAEGRANALRLFRKIKMSKVYLDVLRSGHSPNRQLVVETRDFFIQNGMEVSGGITTTSGKEFGVPSSRTPIFLNYQSEKTRQDMSGRIREIATLFDEFIIDDFFASDDESRISVKAKENRSWSAYRLDLLTDYARHYLISPARSVNPNIRFIIKYPQWYDRFHQFGYDVVREPKIFDCVWVGTETRNPKTETYGYVMPTEGYINYCWLHSIAKEKTGGAWFDFHDCTPNMYLMQAYQSVLAGAERIILFDTESFIKQGASARKLINRSEALFALGGLLHNRKALGMAAYKPPHSDGSDSAGGANLYIYDYIATLGLSPIMIAEPPDSAPVIFLPRHAAANPDTDKHLHRWIKRGAVIVVTPDFLAALNDPKITELAGYTEGLNLKAAEKNVTEFRVGGKRFTSDSPVKLRALPVPSQAEVLCAGITDEGDIPILTRRQIPNRKQTTPRGSILVLNMSTFTHKEIIESELLLLPPRPLTIKDWPSGVVNRIRRAIPAPYPLQIDGPNNTGVYFYEGNVLVLTSFHESPVQVTLTWLKKGPNPLRLDKSFPHANGTNAQKKGEKLVVTIAPWEPAVVHWK